MCVLVCCLPLSFALPVVRRALVIRAVTPVEGLHNLLHALGVAVLLPRIRNRDLQHSFLGFADPIQRIRRVEVERPAGGDVFDADEVVAEDHLWDGDSYLLGELFDRVGFEDGLFARADSPLPIFAGEGLHAGVRAGRHCWGYCAVTCARHG
jgi:hypothetical protein